MEKDIPALGNHGWIVPGQVWPLWDESHQHLQDQQFPFHRESGAGAAGIMDREIPPFPQGYQILWDQEMKVVEVGSSVGRQDPVRFGELELHPALPWLVPPGFHSLIFCGMKQRREWRRRGAQGINQLRVSTGRNTA